MPHSLTEDPKVVEFMNDMGRTIDQALNPDSSNRGYAYVVTICRAGPGEPAAFITNMNKAGVAKMLTALVEALPDATIESITFDQATRQ